MLERDRVPENGRTSDHPTSDHVKRHFLACLIIVGQSLMLYFAVCMSVHLLSLLLNGSS